MELVSIIIPAYNVEAYIDRCLESVTKQSYTKLEIIVVDDGSRDRTPVICETWAKRDTRVKVLRQNNNGVAVARNCGIIAAKGKYLAFVDADDYLPTEAIASLYTRIVKDKSSLAIGKFVREAETGFRDKSFCRWMSNKVMTNTECAKCMGTERRFSHAPWGKLYKKELLENIEFPQLICGEDTWFFADVLKKCEYISVVDEDVYYYIQRQGSAVTKTDNRTKSDGLKGALHMIRYLLDMHEIRGAAFWYKKAIYSSVLFEHPMEAKDLMCREIKKAEHKQMMRMAGIITWLNWIAISSPILARLNIFCRTFIKKLHNIIRLFTNRSNHG